MIHLFDAWCVTKILRSRGLAFVYLTCAALIGYLGYRTITDYYAQAVMPAVALILSAEVVSWPDQRAELIIKVDSPDSPNCVRERQITMEYIEDDGTINYYPLGSARNGLGVGKAGIYFVHYDLPPWVPLGSIYLDRTTYTCPIFPFLSSIKQIAAPDVRLPLAHRIRN